MTRLRFIIIQNKNKTLDNSKCITPEIPALELSTVEQSSELTQLLEFGVAGAVAEEILKKYPVDYKKKSSKRRKRKQQRKSNKPSKTS